LIVPEQLHPKPAPRVRRRIQVARNFGDRTVHQRIDAAPPGS